LLGLIRDELAIFAGQTPDALKTPATPSWLIWWPLARMASAFGLSAISSILIGLDRCAGNSALAAAIAFAGNPALRRRGETCRAWSDWQEWMP
jgi:hypothetical protein